MKRFNLALFAFCFCSIAWAQFYSSERVYCYEYVETINDGIKSRERKGSLYFCNIQKDILGLISTTKEQARIKLVDDPDYYNEKARSKVASSYKDWNRVPSNYGVFAGVYAYITKYCTQCSTNSTYTYRDARKQAFVNSLYSTTAYWGDEYWTNNCYSFSSDRQQLIIWSMNNPEKRDYYKLINQDDLIPNLDFLE